jgi:hypothetical protein
MEVIFYAAGWQSLVDHWRDLNMLAPESGHEVCYEIVELNTLTVNSIRYTCYMAYSTKPIDDVNNYPWVWYYFVPQQEETMAIEYSRSMSPEELMKTLEQGSSVPVENAIEVWTVSAPKETTSLRYLPPEQAKSHAVSLFVCNANGEWHPIEYTADGRYLVFRMESDNCCFCIVPTENDPTPLLVLTSVSILLIITVAVFILVRRNKTTKPTPQSAQT